jgi:hypothetical protein
MGHCVVCAFVCARICVCRAWFHLLIVVVAAPVAAELSADAVATQRGCVIAVGRACNGSPSAAPHTSDCVCHGRL